MIPVNAIPQNRTDAGIRFLKSEYEVRFGQGRKKVADNPISRRKTKSKHYEIIADMQLAVQWFRICRQEAANTSDRITTGSFRHSVMKSAGLVMEKKGRIWHW